MRRFRPSIEWYRPVVEALEGRCLPSVLTVTSTADSGGGTLRAAIAAANSGDTIVFALPKPSTITLMHPLDIENNITVAGPGPSLLTVDQTGSLQRAFNVGFTNHSAIATISGITITGGSALQGAGIDNEGKLTVGNCVIRNNHASGTNGGGGIDNDTFGTIVIVNSQIINNSDNVTSMDAEAGGILNIGTMTLINSDVADNTVTARSGFFGLGGGIDNQVSANLTLIDSTVAGNQISGTTTSAQGGGINNGGTLNMIDCAVSGNSLTQGEGDGIRDFGPAVLINCTLANNIGDADGGGIACYSATVTLNNCTISGNFVDLGSGGGVFINGVPLVLQNTIVADNIATGLIEDDVNGNPTTANNNLIGDGTGTNIVNGTNGNIVGVDPKLGPLQNNGGPTLTLALEPGSPAIDAGSNVLLTTTTDQRGLPRIFNGTVDIGAFESQARPTLVTAAGPGMAPEVKVYDAGTGALLMDFDAYDPHFLGGVRVAVGDVNGDGFPDIITAPGPGGGPDLRVFDGATGAKIEEFYAYDPHFQGGVFVAAGDVNGDGKADIITGPDEFSGPDVRVFYAGNVSGKPDKELLAYAQGFSGGVRVAAADVNGDGKADIITAPGPSGSPDMRIFSGATLAKIGEFLAYAVQFTGGVFVATGDVNGDKVPDIITGAGAGGGPEVRVFDGLAAGMGNPTPTILDDFYAYSPMFSGGVQVAAVALNPDGTADIITGAGPGGGPHLRLFDGKTGLQLQQNAIDSFFPFDPSFTGGVFVGGL
jgi:hypothetical protein